VMAIPRGPSPPVGTLATSTGVRPGRIRRVLRVLARALTTSRRRPSGLKAGKNAPAPVGTVPVGRREPSSATAKIATAPVVMAARARVRPVRAEGEAGGPGSTGIEGLDRPGPPGRIE